MIVNYISSNEERDWVIIRGDDDYAGFLYRILNWTDFSQTGTSNFNNEVTLGINQTFDQTLVYNNSILFFQNAPVSQEHKGRFMIYKTDLGGFVRSSLMNISDIL